MSYDMIDRFLRNNLGDDDYAEYSAALDSLYAPQRKPLTDEEYTALAHRIASKYAHRSDLSYVAYTFLPHTLAQFVRAIEAAHGIKENT